MAVNKVVYGSNTIIDITDSTVDAGHLVSGYSAYNAAGQKITGSITSRSSSDLAENGATVTAPAGYYSSAATKTISSGSEGTPTASKGTVSNHSILVTPSVTNTAGYISGGTKTGTAASVSASELVSGSQTITSNNTYDVTNLAQVVVNVSSGGGSGSVTQDENGYIVLPSTGGGGSSDTWSWMGKNPTLVKDYGATKAWLKDTGYATWTPSTTATTITASSTAGDYTSADIANYDYISLTKFHSHFEYGTGATGTAQLCDFYYTSTTVVYGNYGSYSAFTDNTYTAWSSGATATSAIFTYLGSNGTLTIGYGNNGVYVYSTPSPTVVFSSNKITLKNPAIGAKCSTSYFSTDNATAVNQNTSYYEYHIKLYRVDLRTTVQSALMEIQRDISINGV